MLNLVLLSDGIDQSIIPFVVVFVFLAIVWFVIAIVLGVWIYRDAESRGLDGTRWLIIVLISGIIGVIIYLVVREDTE
jgi:TctA family transporter